MVAPFVAQSLLENNPPAMQRWLFFLLAILAANSLAAVTREAVESPHRTLRQLGRVHLKGIHRDEEHQHRDVFALPNDFSLRASVTTQSVTTNPSIAAPPETSGFRGSIDNGIFPSDAAGAVSASFLLSVTNASVVAQDRSGNRLSDISLADFWHDPAYPDGALYDPRVAHDNDTDHWIICTLYDVSFKKSTLLVAVSDGSNPSLGWHRYRFTIDPNDVLDADLTRMALTRDTIVLTANLFDGDLPSFVGIFTIRESDAFAAPAALPVTLTHAPPNIFDLVPVDNRDDGLPYFVVTRGAVDLAIYTLQDGMLTNARNPDAPALGISNSSPAPDPAPQFGSSLRLNSGPMYVANGVLRSGTLWVATQPYFLSPLRSSVMWWRIVMTSLSTRTLESSMIQAALRSIRSLRSR